MGTVVIRPLAEEERELALPVWSQAFENGTRDMDDWLEMEDRYKGNRVTFGLFDEAGLQATVLVLNSQLQFGPDIVVPMGGVGGVACLPAVRGKGYAGDVIRYALEQMKQAGQVTSVLSPFSWSFYQKLGWDWTGEQRRYTAHTRALRTDPETEFVRAATPADRPRILDLYREFSAGYRGMLIRSEPEWKRMLDDRKNKYNYTFLYEKEGRIEGYLVFHGWKEEETRIREFLVRTPRARRALLGLLHRHEMQVKKFTWSGPPDDGLWNHFLHWDLETKMEPLQMARIVDVAGALACLRPSEAATGVVHLAIRDANAPWNAHTWRVSCAEGRVEVAPTEAAPHIEMDIRQLAQAYFGSSSLSALRADELVTVRSEPHFQALCALFDGPPMWTNDYF